MSRIHLLGGVLAAGLLLTGCAELEKTSASGPVPLASAPASTLATPAPVRTPAAPDPTTTRPRPKPTATKPRPTTPKPTTPKPRPKPTTPRPAPTTQAAASCDPSYPDFCLPVGIADLDCPDIPYRRFRVIGADPHRFDADHDGIGCEKG